MRVWTPDDVVKYLDTTPDDDLIRPLRRLWARQTTDEQAQWDAKYRNAKGFSAYDSKFAGSLMESFKQWEHFTFKQAKALRKMLKKYRAQLAEIANEQEAKREAA